MPSREIQQQQAIGSLLLEAYSFYLSFYSAISEIIALPKDEDAEEAYYDLLGVVSSGYVSSITPLIDDPTYLENAPDEASLTLWLLATGFKLVEGVRNRWQLTALQDDFPSLLDIGAAFESPALQNWFNDLGLEVFPDDDEEVIEAFTFEEENTP